MNRSLKDQVYIISGAAGGLGSTLAKRCAAAGARLVLTDRPGADLDGVWRRLEIDPDNVLLHPADIADAGTGRALAAAAHKRFGRLDGGVACAGVIFFSPLLELPVEHWDTTMAVNLKGTFFFLQGLAREMVERGTRPGSLVAISASSANGPRPNNADYGASKLAVEHVTRTFALELAPHGIRVNCVSPGIIPTPMWEKVDRDRGALLGLKEGELTEKMIDAVPMGRLGETDEIAAAIHYFLSNDSQFTTGQVLGVDGGWSLAHA